MTNNGFFPTYEILHATGRTQQSFHERATAVAANRFGRRVFLRAVVEVSNYCRENCAYCGMRRDNRRLDRFRIALDRLAELLVHHRPPSVTDVNIQTGEDPVAVRDIIIPLIRILRRETPLGVSVCLGTLDKGLYQELQAAGATVYIIKFEVGDPDHYARVLAPGTYAERIEHIRWLAENGWKVSSGFIAGLPGQSERELLANFKVACELPLDGCSVVAIIGGEGAMGRMTKTLFQNIGFQTVVSDRKRPDLPTPREAVSESGVIFLSVLPIDEIPKIISDVESFVSPEHVFLDNAGVKGPVLDSLKKLDSIGASVCSTHPLIRPDSDLTNKQVLIMGVGENSLRARRLAKSLYASVCMETIPFSIYRHDPLAVKIQLVPHLIMRTVQTAVPDLELGKISTPNFERFFNGFQSVISQNPEVSERIIRSLGRTKIGRELKRKMLKTLIDFL